MTLEVGSPWAKIVVPAAYSTRSRRTPVQSMETTAAAAEARCDLLTLFRVLFLLMDQARFRGAIPDLIGPSLRAIPRSQARVAKIRPDSHRAVDADVIHPASTFAKRARYPL